MKTCLSCETHSTARHNVLVKDCTRRIKARQEMKCHRVHGARVENAARFLGWFAGDIWFPSSETHANTLIRPPGDSARVVMVSGSVSQLLELDEIEPHTHTHNCITCIKATIRGLTSLQRAGRTFAEVSCVRLFLRLCSWVTSTFSWCEIFCHS